MNRRTLVLFLLTLFSLLGLLFLRLSALPLSSLLKEEVQTALSPFDSSLDSEALNLVSDYLSKTEEFGL